MVFFSGSEITRHNEASSALLFDFDFSQTRLDTHGPVLMEALKISPKQYTTSDLSCCLISTALVRINDNYDI